VIGLLENDEGLYRGCFIESCCEVDCAAAACNPPVNLEICQVAYGPAAADNAVQATWINGENPYGIGINGYINGAQVGSLPTDPQGVSPAEAVFSGIPPGELRIGVQGDCGDPDGVSATVEATMTVRSATPHTRPIEGEVTCTWTDADGGTTKATWTNADPSAFIDVYVFSDPDTFFLGTIAGDAEEVEVTGTRDTDRIELQFFGKFDGQCYGSEVVRCLPPQPTEFFVRGVCNGVGKNPQITSAIFGLAFLFTGGAPPPCKEACDADDNGAVNISDMIVILQFLFLGGLPPKGWMDQNSDTVADPVCEPLEAGDDCETPNPVCPF
jgi:hypothetical protein